MTNPPCNRCGKPCPSYFAYMGHEGWPYCINPKCVVFRLCPQPPTTATNLEDWIPARKQPKKK